MDKETKEFVEQQAEAQDYNDFLRKMGNEESGIDRFFLEVIRQNSLKIGNLDKDELGLAMLPVRTLLELKRDCDLIPSMSSFSKDFEEQAQDIIATSLSKEGFLIKARITTKKELVDKDKRKERRKGLFGRKEEEEQ